MMTHPETPHDGDEGPAPIVPPPLPADFPPADSPGQEGVLGLRVAAALIDLLLLAGLFVVMASIGGRVSAGGGRFSVWLYDWWLVAFVAIAGLYYFALEAWSGQTVGKRLLGVQVYGAGRSRPSAGAVAGRTLLRLVDFLPFLYLVGFVVMMATGARRQRIGDLAAHTAVARAAPVRHRGLAAVPLAVVLLAAVGLSAYRATSAGGTGTYRAHGVSFDYPAGWREYSGSTSTSGGGDPLWRTAVGPGTQYDLIVVDAYQSPAVTARDIDAITPDLAGVVEQAGMAVQGAPDKITMAGLPGLRFHGTGTVGGTRYASTMVFAFNGTTEYEVNCQYTSGTAVQVQQACDQVTGSFWVSGPIPAAAAPVSSAPSSSPIATTTPSAGTTPGNSPVKGTPGNSGLGAKVVPAPAGFALLQFTGVHNGPISAADFDQNMGAGNLAASLHFVRGYEVTYASNTSDDTIELTLFQFATPADAASFKADLSQGGPASSRADPVIPGGNDYDSTTSDQGTYDHGVIATKGNLAFVIDYLTGSTARAPLVETMARQQYAAL
jgi:uncharacterized RDD family membrane protein YckC